MVAILGYSRAQILEAVQGMYAVVAAGRTADLHFPTGRSAATALGYRDAELEMLPPSLLDAFAGVGYPFHADLVQAGDIVLDVGAGAGSDALIASQRCGEAGSVIALDLTAPMLRKLHGCLEHTGQTNVVAVRASAEHLPLADASVDCITSNGALNLVPDKRRAIEEMFRVLRPGGRLQIADVVINRPVTVDCDDDPRLWVECVVGATIEENLLKLFRDAGFEDLRILRRFDYFAHSPSAQTREIAASFGAHSIELGMRRGERTPAPWQRLWRRLSPLPTLISLWRGGFMGLVALGMALLSCYGTLLAVAALPLLGLSLPLDEGLWAGTILVFATLAVLAAFTGVRRHRRPEPTLVALAGLGVLAYTFLVHYHLAVELAGFGLLTAGVFWDRHLRRRRESRILGLDRTGAPPVS